MLEREGSLATPPYALDIPPGKIGYTLLEPGKEHSLLAAAVILDTNVFVAAGFNRRSASASILEQVRLGRIRMIWNSQTRQETQYIIDKIPPLSWSSVAELFRNEDCHHGQIAHDDFDFIPDPDDRKFAALSEVTGAVLLTNDDDLLSNRDHARLEILTPGEYWERLQK